MNNNAVFVAAVVERDTWSSSVSLVGHENTIQVASYNPRLFRRDPTVALPSISPTKRLTINVNESPSKRSLVNGSVDGDEDAAEEAANVYSVVALGADDRSISIWRTTDTRPLVVAKEAFDRQILDLSWSADGRSVWACSSDGSIAVLDFSDPEPDGMMGRRRKGEMEGLTTAEETKAYLSLFEFPWPPPLEANHMHMHGTKGYQQNAQPYYQMDSYAPEPHHHRTLPPSVYNAPTPLPYSQGNSGMPPLVRPSYNSPSHPAMSASGVPPPPINQAQKVTLTKSGKKRIQPTFLGGGAGIVTSSGAMPPPPSSNAGPDGGMEWAPDAGHGSSRHGYSQPGTSRQHASDSADRYSGEYGYQLPSGSRVPGSGEARILAPQPNVSPRRHSTSGSYGPSGHIPGLDLPSLRTHVSVGLPGDLVFEARNSDDSSGE
jgi:protein HIRA/HIR1